MIDTNLFAFLIKFPPLEGKGEEKVYRIRMLIESIKVVNKQMQHPDLHWARMRRSLSRFYGLTELPDLRSVHEMLDNLESNEIHKLRIVYDDSTLSFTCEPYQIKSIKSLAILNAGRLNYDFKLEDRSELEMLYAARGKADDIIIIRSGLVTDSFYCNLAFLKNGVWWTPYLPLLHGTKREWLLQEGLIKERMITEYDLGGFEKVRLFNAMIEFGEVELDKERFGVIR